MEYKNFTSLPPEKESAFIVYEKTSVESAKKARKIGGIAAAILGVLVIITVFSFEEPEPVMGEEDMGALESAEEEEAAEPDTAAAEEAEEAEEEGAGEAAEGEDSGEAAEDE